MRTPCSVHPTDIVTTLYHFLVSDMEMLSSGPQDFDLAYTFHARALPCAFVYVRSKGLRFEHDEPRHSAYLLDVFEGDQVRKVPC